MVKVQDEGMIMGAEIIGDVGDQQTEMSDESEAIRAIDVGPVRT